MSRRDRHRRRALRSSAWAPGRDQDYVRDRAGAGARGSVPAVSRTETSETTRKYERTQRQNEANELYKSRLTQYGEMNKLRETQLADQAKRIQEYQKSGQALVGGAPGAPTGAQAVQPGADPRLGTPQSPQRTGVPVPPPLPPGVTPEKWAELQAPKLASAVDAYEKAVPQFDEAVKMLRLARSATCVNGGSARPAKLPAACRERRVRLRRHHHGPDRRQEFPVNPIPNSRAAVRSPKSRDRKLRKPRTPGWRRRRTRRTSTRP